MSDHSKPRRWTLPPSQAARDAILGPDYREMVPVREDCITEAEFAAVKQLIERSDIYDVDDQVREIAAVLFEGGEHS